MWVPWTPSWRSSTHPSPTTSTCGKWTFRAVRPIAGAWRRQGSSPRLRRTRYSEAWTRYFPCLEAHPAAPPCGPQLPPDPQVHVAVSSQALHLPCGVCVPGELLFTHVLCSPSRCVLYHPMAPRLMGTSALGLKCFLRCGLHRILLWLSQDQGEGGDRSLSSVSACPPDPGLLPSATGG